MSTEINYEEVRKLVHSPQWPRKIEDFPRDIKTNCIGFALDMPDLNLSSVVGATLYDDVDATNNLMDFFEKVDLSPRKIKSPDEKAEDEHIIIVYEYKYWRFDKFQGCRFSLNEVHLARIELDGTLVEKPSYEDPIHKTTLEELNKLIASDAKEDKNYTGPTYIAIRKPR